MNKQKKKLEIITSSYNILNFQRDFLLHQGRRKKNISTTFSKHWYQHWRK